MLYENALAKMCEVVEVTVPPAPAPAPAPAAGDGEGAATAAESPEQKTKPDAFDDMILMKVLPRITGDTDMVMRIFVGETPKGKDALKLTDADIKGLAGLLKQKGASFKKMKEIVKRGESSGSGTLTFWP